MFNNKKATEHKKKTTMELYKSINNLIVAEGAAIYLGNTERFKELNKRRESCEAEFNKRKNKNYVLRQVEYTRQIREEKRKR